MNQLAERSRSAYRRYVNDARASWLGWLTPLELRTYPAFLILLFLALVSLVPLVFIVRCARALVVASIAPIVIGVIRRRPPAVVDELNPS